VGDTVWADERSDLNRRCCAEPAARWSAGSCRGPLGVACEVPTFGVWDIGTAIGTFFMTLQSSSSAATCSFGRGGSVSRLLRRNRKRPRMAHATTPRPVAIAIMEDVGAIVACGAQSSRIAPSCSATTSSIQPRSADTRE